MWTCCGGTLEDFAALGIGNKRNQREKAGWEDGGVNYLAQMPRNAESAYAWGETSRMGTGQAWSLWGLQQESQRTAAEGFDATADLKNAV